ncbi:MAG: hypothetical protein ACM3JQ_06385 [Candidatus Eiseniibacteriota bacterium]
MVTLGIANVGISEQNAAALRGDKVPKAHLMEELNLRYRVTIFMLHGLRTNLVTEK